ncbi:MAG: GIY-YIG nuclease family protein [Acidobacteria bacterium]|nr:GIY-YIG nuclease family protein [Acidobacteriota bacterium]
MDNRRKRSYQLHIDLEKKIRLNVGRLGTFFFPAGAYVYTGSGKRNIEARLRRHFSATKTTRWHIDYLLRHPRARILRARTFSEEECELNRETAGRIVVNGFGSSDCRGKCGSHLKYLGPPNGGRR